MGLTKVLITVKTYPTLSAKYDELVCTAGFKEDGTWIRIYPITFRKKSYKEQYNKYDWIEIDLVKNHRDFRFESYRPFSFETEIKVTGHIGTEYNWEERKKLCLKKVYSNLSLLISEAKNKKIRTSLAVFKPTKILDFIAVPTTREWPKKKREKMKQMFLFESAKNGNFEIVKKLPYKFQFIILDDAGIRSRMMIEDWETGQLYWNCLARHEGNENLAIEDVKKKYLDDFSKTKDLYLYLGTTLQHHYVALNPFIVIGTFQPKIDLQGRLF